jgi:RimJ/RimL family protein N-acetyltransferase
MAPLEFPDPALTDGFVLLREWREQDARQRYEGFTDPLCQRFSWPGTEPSTPAHVAAALVHDEQERRAGTVLGLAIADAFDPDLICGGASLYDVDRGQARASVGYWLAAHARGRGLATRTVRLLAGWAFTHLAVERLELTCAPDNVASQRVALRCGFVREGVLRAHLPFQGRRRDTMVFSLLPGELREANRSTPGLA